MVNSNSQHKKPRQDQKEQKSEGSSHTNNLAAMCKVSTDIIDQLYNPIDAINRFLNLALQSIEGNSQCRQFLLESKQGIRKTSTLLKQLNNYTKELEKGIQRMGEERRITEDNAQSPDIISRERPPHPEVPL